MEAKITKPTSDNIRNSHAYHELVMLERACKDEDGLKMQKEVTRDVLELLDVFSKQGHSGFSASYVMGLFKRLVDHKPLSPLTGNDDEWSVDLDTDDKTQQNLRCPSLFRQNHDNSTAHFVDDVIFSDNGGVTWFTSSMDRDYKTPVTFPCMPPNEPRRVYIKYTEEVPPGETCDEFIDITDNPEEQKVLREKYLARVNEDWDEEKKK